MKFVQVVSLFAAAATLSSAHPERMTPYNTRCKATSPRELSNRFRPCPAKRAASLRRRQIANGRVPQRRSDSGFSKCDELQYTTIQDDTCLLAPDAVWGPYAIDGEIYRHDVRESQEGVELYLDIGVIDVETCEPLPNAYLTIWHCNSTGSYSGFTGIAPNTAELIDGWIKNSDGTTDEEKFLRGITSTDTEGMAEFLTIFPGHYVTRSTHIHLTVQTNHIGQLFFDESLIKSVYALSPYAAHLATLNRTTNAEDSLYATANGNGYSAVISVSNLGDAVADGLVGYITVGVNSSAAGLTTSGGSMNPIGIIPTVSVADSVRAQATAVDAADGYSS
ncbi:aromatic compound dioxygenase [Hyaloscypha variabilis F]|uniref:Aromatic compound dioxygenase n=1 Tax=Hyaloscypha variabilis (strain UAMH 11265 / GT02V1 / F) TaxID=1149755 RepID=A0A2J6QY05_HYAVF|nr:aromatic compound dioxygenase [Hyaloscypha variabilis F]